jgi:uncharacterized protein (TIGR02453 family)
MRSPFTRKTLSFLRALKRHNNREWFRQRKAQYEEHVREPMIDLLARLGDDLPSFAPELISDPRVSLYRIYRDTRFSADKRPLKTHIAAHFPAKGFPRNEGAGLYLEITPAWVWIGGGLYMPAAADLRAIREHIAVRHRQLRRIVTSPAFRRTVGSLEGEQLSRVPVGYPKDHAAADYLRFKQFLAGREFEAELAIRDRFYAQLVIIFRTVAPLVRFLNAPLLAARADVRFNPAHLPTLLTTTSTAPKRQSTAMSRPGGTLTPMPRRVDAALMRGPRQTARHPVVPVGTS